MIRLHPSLERVLGLVEIEDDVLLQCVDRVRKRCSAVDITTCKRKPAQRKLEMAAKEAIVGAFQDMNPNRRYLVGDTWPDATCILRGESARIEIWIGIDFEDGDGPEPIDFKVHRNAHGLDISERVQAMLTRKPQHEPELVLANKVSDKPASKARTLLDRKRV